MPQEDEPAAESVVSAAATQAALPSGLSAGGVYMLRPMSSSGVHVSAITIEDDEKTITLIDRSALKIEQAFQLIASGSGYKFKALYSPEGKVLDILRKSNGELEDGCTVDLDYNTDLPAQEFVIEGDTSSSCVVRLASNQSLVLARVETSVRLQTYNAAADNQRWRFIERTNTYTKDPDPDAQNKKNWCWAAAAKMVATHNGGGLKSAINTNPQTLTNTVGLHKPYYGYSISGTERRYLADGAQRAIVRYVKGSDVNDTTDDLEKENALRYASANTVTAYHIGRSNRSMYQSEINELNSYLDNGYVIGNMITANEKYGHSVVIEAYYPAKNGGEDKYLVFDPWTGESREYYKSDIFEDFVYCSDGYWRQIRWFQYCY